MPEADVLDGNVEQTPDLSVEAAKTIVDGEPVKPYDWAEDAEQSNEETADPLNPDYVVRIYDADLQPTPECPYFVSVYGKKEDSRRPTNRLTQKTFNSNNGMVTFVDENGAVYSVNGGEETYTRLTEQGYQQDGSLFVYFSNGERPGSKEGNEKLLHGDTIKHSKRLGLTIEARTTTALEGSVEYDPMLQTSDEYIGLREDERTHMLEQIAELQATVPGDEDMVKDTWGDTYSARDREIKQLEAKATEALESIEELRVLESIGVPLSPEQNQVNYDLGHYSVGENSKGQQVIRYVDCHGRYMEAPYSGMALETLEQKGYKQKVEVINSGIAATTSQVSAPRENI